jgi:Leucine-rich repeat (LRR) protein
LVSGNEIVNISEEISLLPNLKYVDFSKNQLRSLDYVFLPEVLYVNLSDNKLAHIPNGIMTKNVIHINVSDNGIGKIPDLITACISLVNLNLSGNKLWYFPDKMDEMVSLRSLDISRNNLTWFPKQIALILSLEELKLDSNKVEGIGDSVRSLTNLRYFSINDNNLKYFPLAFLDGKMQLSFVYMNGNNLSRLPDDIADMPYLCTLDVRRNPISKISDKLKDLNVKPLFQTILGKGNDKVLIF